VRTTRIVVALAVALALSVVTVRDGRAADLDDSPNLFGAGEQSEQNPSSDQGLQLDQNLQSGQVAPSEQNPSNQNLTTQGLSNQDMTNQDEMNQRSGVGQSSNDNDMIITNDATPPQPEDDEIPNSIGRKWPEWVTNYGHRGGAPANAGVPATSPGAENE